MADEGGGGTSKWKFVVEVSEALENVSSLKEGIDSIGETEGLEGIIGNLKNFGLIAGGIGATIYAIKEAMDLAFDADAIDLVTRQFDVLSESAGVYADSLKEGLVVASKGFIDETTLMKTANKALTELQGGVQKLPEAMDMARKASLVFGGTVTENFEHITNAVATGSTRQLRMMGIVIDQKKAYEDYAKSIGSTTDQLTRAQHQAAMMNAVLEQGNLKFKDASSGVTTATASWKQLTTVFVEMKETIVLALGGTLSPMFAKFFGSIKDYAVDAKNYLQSFLGKGTEKTRADLAILEKDLVAAKQRLAMVESDKDTFIEKLFGLSQQEKIKRTQIEIIAIEGQINGLKKVSADAAAEQKKHFESITKTSAEEIKKREEHEQKIINTSNALDEELMNERIKRMSSVAEANELFAEKRIFEEEKIAARIKDIQKEVGKSLTQKEAMAQIAQLNAIKVEKMKEQDAELLRFQIQALNQLQTQSATTFQGMANGFVAMSKKAQVEMKDMSAVGSSMAMNLQSNTTSAFTQMGEAMYKGADGAKAAATAMKVAILGALGDEAIARGSVMVLAGFTNPAWFAPGAALIALGGALKAMAGTVGSAGFAIPGGGATMAPAVSTGTSGMGGAGAGTTTTEGGMATSQGPSSADLGLQSTAPQKQVQLVVQGNLYSSNEAKTEMMNLMRQATDATSFKYVQVSG